MKSAKAVSTSSPSMRRIVAALETHGPLPGHELCRIACITVETFANRAYKGKLIDERLIHVAGYLMNRHGSPSPIFAAGPGPDDPVAPPPPLSAAAKSRAWRERSGYNTAYNEARRAERLRKKPADPVLCALMGIRT